MLEHTMCCGTLCNKRKMANEFKQLADRVKKANIALQQFGHTIDTIEYKEHDTAILVDGHDDALTGYHYNCGPVAVYRRQMIIDKLMERDGMTGEEAEEFFDYNIDPLSALDGGPMFIEDTLGGDYE